MQPAAVSTKAPSPSTAFQSPPWLSTTKMRRRRKATSKVGYAPGVIVSQIVLKPPPYSMDALEPYMSRETLETHWDRHHRAHVDTLNLRISGTHLDGMPLPDILSLSYNNGTPLPAFNHASEVWNHDFFWESMTPRGGGRPSGRLLELVNRDFGSYQRMLKQLQGAASSHFGSGWAWLVYKANRLNVGNAVNPLPSEEDNKLVITNTPNALNPLVWDYSPLLAIDVWEHAYYLDYENCRAKYVSIFMEKLVSWEVVSSRLETAIERAAQREREEERRKEDEEAEMDNSEAVEMYLDSENDSETE